MKVPATLTDKIVLFTRSNSFSVPRSSSLSFHQVKLWKGIRHSERVALDSEHIEDSRAENIPRSGLIRPAIEACVDEAVDALKANKVVAVPTDTLYGFACAACSSEAVHRIYEIKGRAHAKPLAICVGDVSDVHRVALTDHLPESLLESLLPGPVTIVLKRGETTEIEKTLNPGVDSLGVRVPGSEFIRAVARGLGTPVALTSANLSGNPSSIHVKEFEDLWPHCDLVFDGGSLPCGRAGSTVVDLTRPGSYRILRPGSAKDETVRVLRRFLLAEEEA